MIKRLRLILAGLMIIPTLSVVTTVALPSTRAAAACTDTFLTFPAWYKGMQSGDCSFQPKKYTGGPDSGKTDLQATTVAIILNIVNILLQLVGYASVVFLILGGFKYMTSQGEANEIAGAKKTIMNAIIGLIISIASVAIVNLVAGAI